MSSIFSKTFGGLTKQYYFRNLFFGSFFLVMFFTLFSQAPERPGQESSVVKYLMFVMLAVNTLLYPYARFVYESIARFILGNNLIVTGFGLMMIIKYLTMGICWAGALFIAPIGLIYLYFHHSKQS
jgi:hypothetical protein